MNHKYWFYCRKNIWTGHSLHYGVAKSALHGFTLGLSRELEIQE